MRLQLKIKRTSWLTHCLGRMRIVAEDVALLVLAGDPNVCHQEPCQRCPTQTTVGAAKERKPNSQVPDI